MKRIAAIILSALILFSFTACDFSNDSPKESESSTTTDTKESNTNNTAESITQEIDNNNTDNTENKEYSFISQEEKNSWKDKLINVLSNCDIFGSFAVGLMDLNFDNSPEVLIAYPGGSIGNVFITFYDLESGEQLFIYNADHWESSNNINLCITEDTAGDFVIISEGYHRGVEGGWKKYIRVFPKYIDFNAPSFYPNNFLSETADIDSPKLYYYLNQEIDKSEYDALASNYQRIASTQIQLITHEIIGKDSAINTDPASRKEFAETMADALINSAQEFIDCKALGITTEKYPYVPEMYHPILDAYYKMDSYKKTDGNTDGIVAADYPNLSEANFNALLTYTEEFNIYGRGYFLYDINLDGIEELVFSSWGGGTSSKYYVEMIFTGDGNEVKFIGRFENNDYKYFTEIGDDGRIHQSIPGKGDEGVTHHVFSFDKTGKVEVVSYGISDLRDFYDQPCELEWLKFENGDWVNITEEEYTALEETYAFNEIENGFEFRYFIKFAPK